MWIFFFERLYQELFGIEPKTNSIVNACVLTDYKPLFGALFDGKEVGAVIKEFVQSKPYIIEKVKENSSEIFLYQQPIIILLYFLTDKVGAAKVKELWSFPTLQKELQFVFSDLGTQP